MSQWLIKINQERCVGSGTCTATAPELFELNDEDRSCALSAIVGPRRDLLDAAEMCPTAAISVLDARTGEHVAGEEDGGAEG